MEAFLFFFIIITFLVLTFLKIPRGVAFLFISTAIIVISTKSFDTSVLIEGAFGYFDAVLVVLTAMIFIVAVDKSGLLKHIADFLTVKFSSTPRLLLLLSTILAMSGGMITGSSSAAVLTTGAVAFPIFTSLGLDKKKAGTIIGISAVLGMIAPPVNIQALVICEGVDMPYIGFTYPLLWLTLPPALIFSLIIAGKELRKPEIKQVVNFGLKELVLYIPLVVMISLSILDSYGVINLGLPLIFLLSALLSILTKPGKKDFIGVSLLALEQSLPVLAILVGVGMLIQVMTVFGVRGIIVGSMLFFPSTILFLTVGFGVPLFGAISSYGSASVLGIPFLLAFRGGNDILIAAAISLLAGIGDLLPPTALAATVSAQVVGLESYFEILKRSFPYLILIAIYSVFSIVYSKEVNKFFQNPLWLVLAIGLVILLGILLDKSKRK